MKHLLTLAAVAAFAPATEGTGAPSNKPQPTTSPTPKPAASPSPTPSPAASPAATQASPAASEAPQPTKGKPGRPPKDPNAAPAAPKVETPLEEMGMGALLKAANAAAGVVAKRTAELAEAAARLEAVTTEMDKRLK
jgi:hypothetical protein